ncbi:MAG: hypothetical protein ABID64_01495 [Nitrospirota bacterium]
MDKRDQLPLQKEIEEKVSDDLKRYHEKAGELVVRGLIEEEDEEEIMAEKDPDKAKVLLLVALEKNHKEARDKYLNKASKERQDNVDGLA